ncbi:MAG TPA: YIP1 family protein [Candidatus Dormibacteraeota bacterium]|nr:YIP1 family protein [Candidatus Dormibacteraeota bacterium]
MADLAPIRRMLNVLVTPSDVFDEVLASPTNLANWRLPTLWVVLASLASLPASNLPSYSHVATAELEKTQLLAAWSSLISAFLVCGGAVIGTLWSATILWVMGRFFLKVQFSFRKTLEIVGLTSGIVILGIVLTGLLSAALNHSVSPALSILALKVPLSTRLNQALDLFNFFHLWNLAALAIGLSRLSGVSCKEASFWVFGYWLFVRLALLTLI